MGAKVQFHHFGYVSGDPRIQPAVYSISIIGPYGEAAPGDTPSRRRIFGASPTVPRRADGDATRILTSLMKRAYRRPVFHRTF